jgi:hypothetical protein
MDPALLLQLENINKTYGKNSSRAAPSIASSEPTEGRRSSKSAKRRRKKKKKAKKAEEVVDPDFDSKVELAIPADVRMISGCKDHQCSADVYDISAAFKLPIGDGAGGACTHALVKCMLDGPTSWVGLLKRMQHLLKEEKFEQIPQISTSRKLDLHTSFEVLQSGSGNHKALLIGINYVGMQGELRGCHNDVATMKSFLMEQGYSDNPENMSIMCDNGVDTLPTKENILEGFRWLINDVKPGDSLFLHYSGHGASIPDQNRDEADGMDEALCPVDYQEEGLIVDDDVYAILVDNLPKGVVFTILMDCCHSGTIMDLPYVLNFSGDLVAALEAGEAQPDMVANANFDVAQLVAVGMRVYQMAVIEQCTAEQLDEYVQACLGMNAQTLLAMINGEPAPQA